MQRDMNLIRELLLKLEAMPLRPAACVMFDHDDADLTIPGYDFNQVRYHFELLKEVDLIASSSSGTLTFSRLTWAGHDYLDAVRDPEIWEKTKSGAYAVGGMTFDLIKDLAKGFIKKQIEQRTGIQI